MKIETKIRLMRKRSARKFTTIRSRGGAVGISTLSKAKSPGLKLILFSPHGSLGRVIRTRHGHKMISRF